ncbi:MAG: hypothetical protein KY475_02340 [Planctomycetes bacterium]|nr:hypothetical protein [Planctomycetota bacterium]
MNPASTLRFLALAWLSRPAHERRLYRSVRKAGVRSIVELGVGDARRAKRLLAVAQRYAPQSRLSYTGIDLFEARTADSPGLSLKEAHRELTRAGAQLRLMPGDPFSALARCANALTNTDLLIISADVDAAALERAWFYVPRMLHDRSQVFLETRDEKSDRRRYRRLTLPEIAELANREPQRRAA